MENNKTISHLTIEQIANNYMPNVAGWLKKRYNVNPDTAKDIIQETLIKAWLNAEKFSPDNSVFTWLAVIAKNTLLDWQRRHNKISNFEDLFETNDFKCSCINPETMDLELNLNKLDSKYRYIMYLCYLKQYTHVEISKTTGVPLGTVKSRIQIGLRELRKIYC